MSLSFTEAVTVSFCAISRTFYIAGVDGQEENCVEKLIFNTRSNTSTMCMSASNCCVGITAHPSQLDSSVEILPQLANCTLAVEASQSVRCSSTQQLGIETREISEKPLQYQWPVNSRDPSRLSLLLNYSMESIASADQFNSAFLMLMRTIRALLSSTWRQQRCHVPYIQLACWHVRSRSQCQDN